MRQLLLVFFYFILTPISFADSWDNMSLEQAQKTVNYLKKNPFILSYCDCCDYKGEYATEVFLLEVMNSEVIPCDWSEGQYSVKTYVVKIAQITYTNEGLKTDKLISTEEDPYPFEYIMSMNYTFVFDWNTRKAVHLMEVIPYEDGDFCRGSESFPDPQKSKGIIKDQDYIQWYEKRVRQ